MPSPAGFRVVEEREAALLLERARGEGLAAALRAPGGANKGSPPLAARRRAPRVSTNCCASALGLRAEIAEAVGHFGDSARVMARLLAARPRPRAGGRCRSDRKRHAGAGWEGAPVGPTLLSNSTKEARKTMT